MAVALALAASPGTDLRDERWRKAEKWTISALSFFFSFLLFGKGVLLTHFTVLICLFGSIDGRKPTPNAGEHGTEGAKTKQRKGYGEMTPTRAAINACALLASAPSFPPIPIDSVQPGGC